MGSESGDTNKHGASSTEKGHANGQGEESGKGKGKDMATDETGQETPRQADGDSFMARIGKSAAGLSRSVFHGTLLPNELASAGAPGKAEASSAAASNVKPETLAESSSTARASSSTGAEAFRSGQAEVHAAAQEAAFSDFLDETEVYVPTENIFETAWQAAGSTASKSTDHEPVPVPVRGEAVSSSVAEQQRRDGSAVVDLLSRGDEEMPQYEEEEQTRLSETELRNLRRALFEDGSPAQKSASDWNSILNFVPDFLRGEDDGYMNLGVTSTAEAGQLWLEEWNRVLTGYTDEVWGDLGDLVREARADVEKARESPEAQPDVTALRRLQTVLTRVRARL